MTEQEKKAPDVGSTEAPLDLSTLSDNHVPDGHRSGFVAVVGRPNVGKSTLMNVILGQKVAIVSPKPQTTRIRQLGILTLPNSQVIFVDTPGYHQPQHKLGEFMVETIARSIPDADVVLFVIDVSEPPRSEDRLLAERIVAQKSDKVIMVLNKMDLLQAQDVLPRTGAFRELIPSAQWLLVSATEGENQDELIEMIINTLPEGPRYYPDDQVTDTRVRDLAGELVREKALEELRDEIPHGVAVLVDEYKEREADLVYIKATLIVERDSHKRIVIGKNGSVLKKIGSAARKEMESVLGVRVYLDLWVKVRSGWRKNANELRRLGYVLPKDS